MTPYRTCVNLSMYQTLLWIWTAEKDKPHTTTATSVNRQIREKRDDASAAIKRIINGNTTNFEMVPFGRLNKVARLRSIHYKGYFVICHSKTICSDSWILCGFAENGSCSLENALHIFKTVLDGTSKLDRHPSSHEYWTGAVRFQRALRAASLNYIDTAAALSVCGDIRTLSFCEGDEEICYLAQYILEMEFSQRVE